MQFKHGTKIVIPDAVVEKPSSMPLNNGPQSLINVKCQRAQIPEIYQSTQEKRSR